ncbi:LysR family transcriptional regulator [Leptothoe kymatousa TAU-MAC 1615]|uniref:LysR family transcriptional regulator n=2 Tax=Leptothoe TaxID=2651725 RepID=A0ABS5Y758_9CYAN|nr:LysR family transcriptional regulator [Leptothoe kymatousa TAU-MAC 1615]
MFPESSARVSLDLRHLQTFLIVAEEMSFSRAAKRLGISQPPLSRQISRLEANLGIKLFERTRPQIKLTAAGKVFAEHASGLLQQFEHSVQLAKRIANGNQGELKIAIDSAVPACDRAVSLTKNLGKNAIIQEMAHGEQCKAIQAHQMDIGFMAPQRVPGDLIIHVLKYEPLVVILPSHHPLAIKSQLSFYDLADEPFVMHKDYADIVTLNMRYSLQLSQFQPPVVQTASDRHLIMSFVAAGLGISLLPASTIASCPRNDIVHLPLEQNIEIISLAAVWHRNNTNPDLTTFIDLIKQQMPDMRLNRISEPVSLSV